MATLAQCVSENLDNWFTETRDNIESHQAERVFVHSSPHLYPS
jgi:hypothetical protein